MAQHEAALLKLQARVTAAQADGEALRAEEARLLEEAQHPPRPAAGEGEAMAKWEETQECLAGNAAEAAHIAQKEEEQRWWARARVRVRVRVS